MSIESREKGEDDRQVFEAAKREGERERGVLEEVFEKVYSMSPLSESSLCEALTD